jgi:hypothetical protein
MCRIKTRLCQGWRSPSLLATLLWRLANNRNADDLTTSDVIRSYNDFLFLLQQPDSPQLALRSSAQLVPSMALAHRLSRYFWLWLICLWRSTLTLPTTFSPDVYSLFRSTRHFCLWLCLILRSDYGTSHVAECSS